MLRADPVQDTPPGHCMAADILPLQLQQHLEEVQQEEQQCRAPFVPGMARAGGRAGAGGAAATP